MKKRFTAKPVMASNLVDRFSKIESVGIAMEEEIAAIQATLADDGYECWDPAAQILSVSRMDDGRYLVTIKFEIAYGGGWLDDQQEEFEEDEEGGTFIEIAKFIYDEKTDKVDRESLYDEFEFEYN